MLKPNSAVCFTASITTNITTITTKVFDLLLLPDSLILSGKHVGTTRVFLVQKSTTAHFTFAVNPGHVDF